MLVEKYESVNLFDLVPLERDAVLDQLDRLLEQDRLFQVVKGDLALRYPGTLTCGRPSTPVEVILRMLVTKHLYSWSYEQTEVFVSDSIVLRQFCRVYLNAVPDDTVLIRWANLIRPETLHQLLERVTVLSRQLKVTRGRKLRTDGTVVESNIHHPTDSSLLVDGVRVLGRALRRARKALQDGAEERRHMAEGAFRNRLRSARRAADEIRQATRRGIKEADDRCRRAYGKLVQVARAMVKQTQAVVGTLEQVMPPKAQALATELSGLAPLVEQVICQTVRRVLKGEPVPADQKTVSLFEPHTDIIVRGREAKPVEFGHKVWLSEVEGGILSDYRILRGNPSDHDQWVPSLEQHCALFERPPDQASADRGVYSRKNETVAEEMGVRRAILPKPGHRSCERKQHENQAWFRRGRRYHQGIEGRISLVKRRFGLRKCLYHGEDGFERWVGWGIIAYDLRVIGIALAAR